jgi:uncharacterized damage-inducible protein DinB
MESDLAKAVRSALTAGLGKLHGEVRSLVEPLTEEQLWKRPIEPGNSIGHLILHLTGNLKHFVGAQLGGTGYVRDREREFTESRPPSKAVLLAGLDEAVGTFDRVVGGLGTEQLLARHPEARFGSVVEALMHIIAHFALHRGQMSYIARLVR